MPHHVSIHAYQLVISLAYFLLYAIVLTWAGVFDPDEEYTFVFGPWHRTSDKKVIWVLQPLSMGLGHRMTSLAVFVLKVCGAALCFFGGSNYLIGIGLPAHLGFTLPSAVAYLQILSLVVWVWTLCSVSRIAAAGVSQWAVRHGWKPYHPVN